MSKQPPSAPTASAVGSCPTVIQIVGRPGTGSLPSTIALGVLPAPLQHPTTLDSIRGWSGGVMVLGILPVPERPTYFDLAPLGLYGNLNSLKRSAIPGNLNSRKSSAKKSYQDKYNRKLQNCSIFKSKILASLYSIFQPFQYLNWI